MVTFFNNPPKICLYIFLSRRKNERKKIHFIFNQDIDCSHVPGVMKGPEKSKLKKGHHLMFVQAILSQKNKKSKFFKDPFLRNCHFSIFSYVKLEAK